MGRKGMCGLGSVLLYYLCCDVCIVMWYQAMRCETIVYLYFLYVLLSYDMYCWYDMILYDIDIIWYDMIWYDTRDGLRAHFVGCDSMRWIHYGGNSVVKVGAVYKYIFVRLSGGWRWILQTIFVVVKGDGGYIHQKVCDSLASSTDSVGTGRDRLLCCIFMEQWIRTYGILFIFKIFTDVLICQY